jgi:dienelactone hydrolase
MALIAGIVLYTGSALHAQLVQVDQVRRDFKTLLHGQTVDANPSFQPLVTDSALIEKGFFYSEKTEQVPVLIYRPLSAKTKKLPVVICLHGTGGSKDGMKDYLYRFSKSGFMAVSIDGRYHGARIKSVAGENQYVNAIICAWQNQDSGHQEHPFFFDTVYDLWKLVDYLVTRTVDINRIGMMGISKGGIETWMAAAVDTRIIVAVPVIAAQSFNWSLENDRWAGRAKTIWNAHLQAAKGLGDTGLTGTRPNMLN